MQSYFLGKKGYCYLFSYVIKYAFFHQTAFWVVKARRETLTNFFPFMKARDFFL